MMFLVGTKVRFLDRYKPPQVRWGAAGVILDMEERLHTAWAEVLGPRSVRQLHHALDRGVAIGAGELSLGLSSSRRPPPGPAPLKSAWGASRGASVIRLAPPCAGLFAFLSVGYSTDIPIIDRSGCPHHRPRPATSADGRETLHSRPNTESAMNSVRPVPIFTPEQIEILHTAYAVVCGRLGLKIGDRATEDVAARIVGVATKGVCDVESLTAAVLTTVGAEAGQSITTGGMPGCGPFRFGKPQSKIEIAPGSDPE
jgi:hypothetical protein